MQYANEFEEEVLVGYTQEELLEARRQIASILHKLREAEKSLQTKENAVRLKSQITLAQRRIAALEIADDLLARQLKHE